MVIVFDDDVYVYIYTRVYIVECTYVKINIFYMYSVFGVIFYYLVESQKGLDFRV